MKVWQDSCIDQWSLVSVSKKLCQFGSDHFKWIYVRCWKEIEKMGKRFPNSSINFTFTILNIEQNQATPDPLTKLIKNPFLYHFSENPIITFQFVVSKLRRFLATAPCFSIRWNVSLFSRLENFWSIFYAQNISE